MKWPLLATVCVMFDLVMSVAMDVWPAAATPIRLAAFAVTACFVGLASGGPRLRP